LGAFEDKSLGAAGNQDVSCNLSEPEPRFQEHSEIGVWLHRHASQSKIHLHTSSLLGSCQGMCVCVCVWEWVC